MKKLHPQILSLFLIVNFIFSTINTRIDLPAKDWTKVILSETMNEYLEDLSTPEERVEQERDWILYSILTQMDLSEKEILQSTYKLSTTRQSYLNDLSVFQYGESRSLILPDDKVLALLPSDTTHHIELLSNIVDNYRMEKGKKPSEILIYEYLLTNLSEDTENIAQFKFVEGNKCDQYFSPRYGYVEKLITSKEDLEYFINIVDDLIFVKESNKGIMLGGRQFNTNRKEKLTIENVATLYKAYGDNKTQRVGFSLEPNIDYESFAQKLEVSVNDSEIFYRNLIDNEGFTVKEVIYLREALQERLPLLIDCINEVGNHVDNQKNSKQTVSLTSFNALNRQLKGIFDAFTIDSLHNYDNEFIINDVWEVLKEKDNYSDEDSECWQKDMLQRKLKKYKEKEKLSDSNEIDRELWKSLFKDSSNQKAKIDALRKYLHMINVGSHRSCVSVQ